MVVVVVEGDKSLQTSLHIFIEAFQQTQSQSVLDLHVLYLIIDGVVAVFEGFGIILSQVIVLGCIVSLIDVVVIVPLERVEDTGDRHVFTFHRSIDGILYRLCTV